VDGLRARIAGPAVRILEFGDAPAGRSPADAARDRIRELAPGTPVSVEHPEGHPVLIVDTRAPAPHAQPAGTRTAAAAAG
jgi:hypothetical protein